MINLFYKIIKPYIYQNLVKKLTKESEVVGDYYSTQILSAKHELSAGWYMLELQAKGDFETAKLDVCFAELPNFPLMVRAKKLMKRIIYLPSQAAQIDLSFKIYGEAKLSLLRFVPIKESFAQERMLKRLSAYPNMTEAELLVKLNKKATIKKFHLNQVIFEAYNRLFFRSDNDTYHQWIENIEQDLIEGLSADWPVNISIDEYIYIVDANYILPEASKALLAQFLASNPEAVLAYPDEDQFDQYNSRLKPWFKTDWNYDLFLGQDYISHCFVCRKAWYEEKRHLFEAESPQKVLTLILPTMEAKQIVHLPLVLVHKKYSSQSDKIVGEPSLVRADALQSVVKSVASIEAHKQGLKLEFLVPKPEPLVSLIIPTRNRLNILKPCVESILEKTSYENFEVLIIDNQSTDKDILDWFESIQLHPQVKVLTYDRPFNYSAINNFGVSESKGSIIGLINNDVEVISANWLTEMVSHACRDEIGCVGAKLYYSNGQIQHAGVILGLGHVAGHAHRFAERYSDGYFGRLNLVQNYSAVTGACLLVRRAIYEQVNGLNERDLPVAYNDVDFCLRVRAAGYRNLWTPHAELYHHESVSRGDDDTPEKKARFDKEVAYMRTTWSKELDNDPCYNPNLSRLREDFSLREFF